MSEALEKLAEIASTCTACKLSKERKNVVFGGGRSDAPLMIIGEAPGADEDAQGEPFVGSAGKRLRELLHIARISLDDVYLTNVLLCRPPKNRFPDGAEPEICRRNYLIKQIKLIQPKAVVLAGKQPLKYVLLHGTTEEADPVVKWVNKQYRRRDLYGDIRFLVIYHPSYLIRQANRDEEAEEDIVTSLIELMSYVRHKLDGTAPAPTPFKDIRPPLPRLRQGRNLFGRRD